MSFEQTHWKKILCFISSITGGLFLVWMGGWDAANKLHMYNTNDLTQRVKMYNDASIPVGDRHHWDAVIDSGNPVTLSIKG